MSRRQIQGEVPYRKLVNDDDLVIDDAHPLPVKPRGESPFDEQLIAERASVFSLSSIDPLSVLRDLVTTSGSGTVTHEVDEYRCNAPAEGDEARLESAEVGRYIAGFAAEIGLGIRLMSLSGGEVEWGVYDGADGFTFRFDSSGLYVEARRDGTATLSVERADWNVDPLDGTGPSEINVVEQYGSVEEMLKQGWIWQVRWTWYGYGVIEWRLVARGNRDESGPQRVWTVHRYKVPGETSIRQPNLPVWIEARDGADTYVGGRQYSIIGAKTFSTSRTVGDFRLAQTITDDGSWYPMIAIRRNPSEVFADGVKIVSEDFQINADPKIVAQLFLCPAGTVTGGSWVDVRNTPANESAVEVNRTATEALTLTDCIPLNLRVIASGDAKRGGSVQSPAERTALPRDLEMVLAARGTGANNSTADSVLTWLESR